MYTSNKDGRMDRLQQFGYKVTIIFRKRITTYIL